MNEDYVYNRKILYSIILFVLILAGVGLKFYLAQTKENSALRVKMLSLSKIKRTPLPWSRLTQESIVTINKQAATNKGSVLVAPTITTNPTENLTNEAPISDQSTETLATNLTQNMLNIKNLALPIIDKSIEMANEIISREPNSYSAYKAKLISMIVKENKFNLSVDDYELDKVLDSMAAFEFTNDQSGRKEATLIAKTNNQLVALENKLDDISLQRDEVSTQSAALDKSSPEYLELEAENEQLVQRELKATEDLENLQNNISNGSVASSSVNEDIVEIPFMRLLAKSDYDAVIENAQSFIEQFPNSTSGYYYLIKALELEGRTDDAIRVIEESTLSPEAQNALNDRLDATSFDDHRSYWEKLKF